MGAGAGAVVYLISLEAPHWDAVEEAMLYKQFTAGLPQFTLSAENWAHLQFRMTLSFREIGMRVRHAPTRKSPTDTLHNDDDVVSPMLFLSAIDQL